VLNKGVKEMLLDDARDFLKVRSFSHHSHPLVEVADSMRPLEL
jgi:hypothetical protein